MEEQVCDVRNKPIVTMLRILTILFLLTSLPALGADLEGFYPSRASRRDPIVNFWYALSPEQRTIAQSYSGLSCERLWPYQRRLFQEGLTYWYVNQDDDWGPNFTFHSFPSPFHGWREREVARIHIGIERSLATPFWTFMHVRLTMSCPNKLLGMLDLNITVIEQRSIDFIRIHSNPPASYPSFIRNISSPIAQMWLVTEKDSLPAELESLVNE
jgi:hypothetical protein